MGGINRYDDISVSAYNPMTTQEIMMVPMMRRSQHDEANKQLQTQISELGKVDPYDKHFDRAQQIKSDLRKQVDLNAESLAKEGFNNNTTASVFKTNREIQDQFSPTGEIGQINAEKQNILKINEDYDKLGKEKNWGQETTNYWKQKALDEYNANPIYDSKGRISKYSGPEGIANKVDYNKWLHDLAGSAKMSTREFANAVTNLGKDEASGYSVATKNSYSQKLGDNYKQVKAAYDTLKATMSDPTSEVYKSMQYEQRDPKALLNILDTQKEVYKQSVNATESGRDVNPFGAGDGSNEDKNAMPTGVFDPNSQNTIDVSKNIEEIDRINSNYWSEKDANDYKWGNNPGSKKTGVHTYKTVFRDNPILEKIYENTYNKLIANKKLTSKDSINSEKSKSLIKFYMNNYVPKTITTGNDIIRPDVTPNSQLFMGELAGKSPADRNEALTQDVRSGEDGIGFRTMIDSKTKEKVKLGDGEKIQYLGYDSPVNVRNYGFGNKFEQNVMAHKAQVVDAQGNFIREVTISRTPQEMKLPEFKRAYEINQIYRNALTDFGNWVQPSGSYSKSSNIKKYKVRYNQDGTFQLKFGDKVSEKMDAGRYGVEMNAILSDVN